MMLLIYGEAPDGQIDYNMNNGAYSNPQSVPYIPPTIQTVVGVEFYPQKSGYPRDGGTNALQEPVNVVIATAQARSHSKAGYERVAYLGLLEPDQA